MMLFTSIFSLLTLATLGQSAPAPVKIEDRGAKFHCITKFSGKLSGLHHNNAFPFTKSGNLVTYSGDHPANNNVLRVDFQACSDASGNIKKEDGDWIGRLRMKNTNSCIDLGKQNGAGEWLPKIAPCASTLTDAQTWRYDTVQFGLFWGGFFNFGNPVNEDGEVCRAGYEQVDDGKPTVTSHKQIQVDCAGDDLSRVHFWKLL